MNKELTVKEQTVGKRADVRNPRTYLISILYIDKARYDVYDMYHLTWENKQSVSTEIVSHTGHHGLGYFTSKE